MFCTTCGNQLRDGAVFCPKCGSRLAITEIPPAPVSADQEFSELIARVDSLTEETSAAETPVAAPPVQAPPPPPVYTQPVYAQQTPVYAPPAPEKKKSRAWLIILFSLLGALLFAAAIFFSLKFFLADDDKSGSSSSSSRRDEEDDADADEDADDETGKDADPGEEEAPAGTGDEQPGAEGETPAEPEAPAEPEQPAEPEVPAEPVQDGEAMLDDVETLLLEGNYDDALALLAQINDPAQYDRFEALQSAATMNPQILSVDCSEFPTIAVTVSHESTLFFADQVTLYENGVLLIVDTMEDSDATGLAVFTCAAHNDPTDLSPRTVTVEISIGEIRLQSELVYQPPAPTHSYELFCEDVSWEEAVSICEEMGGHLMTITSEEEMQIAIELASEADMPYTWLGGYTEPTADGIIGHWITGEEMEYQSWATGEPSGADRDGTPELYMMLWNIPALGGWTWNDQRLDPVGDGFYSGEIAFICEWEVYE